jgi:hypothetical protein
MFRAALIAVLLTLAIGQNSRLLCRVWCDSHIVSTPPCTHETTPDGTIVIDASCDVAVEETTAFIREDRRRGSSAIDRLTLLTIAGFQLPSPAAHVHPRLATARALRSAAPPIVALRV